MTTVKSSSRLTSIHIRLDQEELAALDAWNAGLKPKFTRPQAIRFALRNQLLQLDLLPAVNKEIEN
jgi:hypothetical protein